MSLRTLRVQHDTHYAHAVPVELAHHVAYLVPRDTPQQRVLDWHLHIDPWPDGWVQADWEVARRLSRDAWGNQRLVFSHSRVHQDFSVRARCRVQRLSPSALDPASDAPWEQVAQAMQYRKPLPDAPERNALTSEAAQFCLPSPHALPDATLHALARRAFTPGLPLHQGARALMAQIHASLRYEPGSTDVHTAAADAWAQGAGVCQDFAQVFIAACRSLGLAARYVSGYLLTAPPPGQLQLIGADASHAWVECWSPSQGWLGLDPTNNCAVAQDHVLLAWGRDQADVAPLRGVLRGGSAAAPEVAVTVCVESDQGA